MNIAALLGALSVPVLAAGEGLVAPTEPLEVAGGELVSSCGWPTTVVMLNFGEPFCTGTIVHPNVVLLAAHCIDPSIGPGDPTSIGFGEDGYSPIGEIEPAFCGIHPEWFEGNSEGFDVAYCVLPEAVDLDFVPPLMGCEWDAMVPGAQTYIVGFGADHAILDPGVGWTDVSGVGPKRWAPQILEGVFDNAAYLLGMNAGGCPGDSGGPAMIVMPDGSWRVIGAASRIHPDTPPNDTNWCGYGTVYSTFAHVMPWLELETGVDLTPCHDAAGGWAPDDRCNEIPLRPWDPGSTSGTWADGCATNELNVVGALCGPPFDGPPPEPPPPDPPPEPPPEPPPPDPPPQPPPSTTGPELPGGTAEDGSSSDDGGGELVDQGLVERGCACTGGSPSPGAPWWALMLVPLARRRSRRRRGATASDARS